MNNSNNLGKYFILLVILMVFVIQFSITNYFESKKNKNEDIPQYTATEQNAKIQEVTQNSENIETLSNSETEIKYNTVIFEISYSECSHTKTTKTEITDDLTLEDIQKAYPNAYLKETSESKVIFSKIEQGKCDEHYVIKEKDGKVAIFLDKPIKNILLKQMTDIDYSTISQAYKSEIEKGLYIDSNTELELTIEAIKNSSLIS